MLVHYQKIDFHYQKTKVKKKVKKNGAISEPQSHFVTSVANSLPETQIITRNAILLIW